MKIEYSILMVWSAALAIILTGCGKKTDANSELERAVSAMNQSAPAQPLTATATAPGLPPAQEMNQAMAAYKGGNFEDAITRLQNLRAAPVMTPAQRIAVNDAVAAVMSELYTLAEKGDARAIQAIKQYQQMQTRR